MLKRLKIIITSVLIAVALPVLAFVPAANAVTNTVVTQTNQQGWTFNQDPIAATNYEFNKDKPSIGQGSLYVKPIGANASDKFIAIKELNTSVANYNSTSYDFQIAGDSTPSDANQFYLNVYANLAGSTTYYDCRFDYVPTVGSTSDFTTASFTSTSTPVNVADRSGDDFTCPATLDQMPVDATVKFVAINVGDTSANDEGLAGYLDNVVISTSSNDKTYDFEKDLTKLMNKSDCKNGGWATSESPVFKNQGDCVSSFASKNKSN